MSALPRLNAFGSYQLNDSRMFGFGAGAYLAGIRLSWDIFKGNSVRNRNAALTLEKSRLSEQYAWYKEQSRVELIAALRKLADAEFSIRQEQAAVEGAAESYRILFDRYEQGLSGSTDVLLAQTQWSQQKLALARAFFNRDITKVYIDYLTSSSGK
jgi:outer membrane protein TolC